MQLVEARDGLILALKANNKLPAKYAKKLDEVGAEGKSIPQVLCCVCVRVWVCVIVHVCVCGNSLAFF